MSAVLPSDFERDERLAGTAGQDERFIGQYLGRSRPRLAERTHRIREQIQRIRRPLVVLDRVQAVDVRTCAESIQARALGETPASARTPDTEAISHSDRLALVDHGRIVGFFESSNAHALDELVGSAALAPPQPGWVRSLPTVNASLNAPVPRSCWSQAGWRSGAAGLRLPILSILPAENRAFQNLFSIGPPWQGIFLFMLSAFATSSIFLACYLVYHFLAGSMPFRHGGAVRVVYFTILLSHTLLATFGVVPLVIATLFQAVRGDFAKHAHLLELLFPFGFMFRSPVW